MELSSSFVGTLLKEYRKEITWRETMNYAAAIGDNNPFYFDDEQEGGIIAPPMFSVAVTWPIQERIGEYIEFERFPKEVLFTQVHYTEHLAFHRPIKPGDLITVKGKIIAILPHRSGTQVVICFEALDREGKLVFVEHTGALMRGVSCADEGLGQDSLPSVPSFQEKEKPLWETAIPIDPLTPFLYDGCTNIFFPIHTSKRFARQVGLPGIILQGTATLAFAAREIINREIAGHPWKLQALSCRFTGMVFPGTRIQVKLLNKTSHSNGTDLHFVVQNHKGQKAISQGYAFLKSY